MSKVDESELKKLIVGRVTPHIYSFATNTLPNYLKVGDTYRPIEERLNEWRKYYSDLEEISRHKAMVDDGAFFRDYAVHKYLLQKGFMQLQFDTAKKIFSSEFFKDVHKSDVQEAIEDIIGNYQKTDTYEYYDNAKELQEFHYQRIYEYSPRENQQVVINNFNSAVKSGRTNLLMYAVMRFGKSITSMWCARSVDSKLTVIVSAKADVCSEWKQTVESHTDFTGYRFLDSDDLKKGMQLSDLYGKKFKNGNGVEEICTNIVLFLTLQDLAGSTETIKKHHEILQTAQVNLLIIDETHFGARAQVLGKILAGVEIDDEDKLSLKIDKEDPENFGSLNNLKAIKAKIKLHLSGTPYRILMGSEFKEDDIIAFVQFADIYEAKQNWNAENLEEDEWKNPYYGFPQMIRFAFNPNESSRRKLAKNSGSNSADLFEPVNKFKSGNYETFIHQEEVTDLLQVLDGSKNDTNMLGLLDNETIKAGKLARHVVIALPYRASCDALEKLIRVNKLMFKNIAEYEVLNISGHNKVLKTTEEIKRAIAKAESENKKTITLTVNKMLTGSTVQEWDTMIYLKRTSSPQEYDQAIFRLQSPWIKKYEDEEGNIIKYDMKPQTLLVDLDPTRMFYLQEVKAFTYGANTRKIGSENIEEFIKRELRISPIITLNAEKNKLVEVTATNIIDQARKYANDRSITEDVKEIGIDASLKDNPAIYDVISNLAELGGKNGLNIKPYEEEGDELDIVDAVEASDDENIGVSSLDNTNKSDDDQDISSFERRFRTYYVKILLFSFLSQTQEKSLTDVIDNIDINEDNRRIARNLGLKKHDLVLIRDNINPFVLSTLDYKIQNSDFRSYDNTITPIEHIDIAIHKFGRLSDAEVFTPSSIVMKMYNAFNESFWNSTKNARVLDIASKSGSFAKGFVDKGKEHGIKIEEIWNNFYSIPTSPAAYEFTRKMYQALGLNVDNIAANFTSFDLIKFSDDEVKFLLSQNKKYCDISLKDLENYDSMANKEERKMKFSAVVGNPPYQEKDGGAQASAVPVYNLFVEMAKNLNPNYISMIMPTRWYAGGKGLNKFRDRMLNDVHISELHDFLNPELIFSNINLRGGICYFMWDSNYDNTKILTKVFTYESTFVPEVNVRSLKTDGSNILIRHKKAIEILNKVTSSRKFESLEGYVSTLRPFGFRGYFIKDKKYRGTMDGLENPIVCYGKGKKIGYVDRSEITSGLDMIDKYKVFTPRANNIGTELNDDNLNTFVGGPGTICTESYIAIGSDLELNNESSINLGKYLKTKFARFQHSVSKASQDATAKTYKYVPIQIFTSESDIDWTKSIADIDKQLYKKYGLDDNEINFIETHVKAME